MKPGLQQHQTLRQDLRINPRLFQAMDLLYMPLLDLQQHLKQELLANPFLELVEPEDEEEGPDDEVAPSEAQDLAEPEVAPEAEPERTGDDEVVGNVRQAGVAHGREDARFGLELAAVFFGQE